jgi:alanyl-tRNA synthetase
MWRLVPVLLREMGTAYPELTRAEALIVETLRLEETRFRVTLTRGLAILDEETKLLPQGGTLAGSVAFKLYDTYGFPLDLTQDALRARQLGVDVDGFNQAMAHQRAEARRAWAGSGEAATEKIWFELKEKLGASEFLGYETETAEAVVAAILQDGHEVAQLGTGASGQVILNQTPFYGESGGQLGDTGMIRAAGVAFRVTNTQKKLGDLIVHEGTVEAGTLTQNLAVELSVDHARRRALRANHSATHLLHEALRQVLGDHVAQKGSLVAPDRLRFDFAHPKPISPAELARIEDLANRAVLANTPVSTRVMDIDEAITSGARALFGEKYGDQVRVVTMGDAAEVLIDEVSLNDATAPATAAFSVELCGGTHVYRTGDIGLISVVAESPVAAGVRRIEAKTGEDARHYLNAQAERLHELAQLLKAPEAETTERLTQILEDRRRLERDVSDARKKLAMGGSDRAQSIEEIAGIKFFGRTVSGVEMKDLKSLADEAKASVGSGIVAIVGVGADGKAGVVVAVTQDLSNRFDAVALVRIAAEKLGGKGGGGRRDMAQAGGPDGAAAASALAAVGEALRETASAA